MALDHIGDMIVINLDVVEGTDSTDDTVGHRDGPHLQTAAELHIRLDTPQQKDIGSEPSDIHHEGTGIALDNLGLGYDGGICLGINQNLMDHQTDWGTIEHKLYAPSFEILRKTAA